MLGGIGGRRRRGRQRMRWLDGITDSMGTWVWVNSGSLWWTGRRGVLGFMGSQRVWHDWATELNWTEDVLVKCLGRMYMWEQWARLCRSIVRYLQSVHDCSGQPLDGQQSRGKMWSNLHFGTSSWLQKDQIIQMRLRMGNDNRDKKTTREAFTGIQVSKSDSVTRT